MLQAHGRRTANLPARPRRSPRPAWSERGRASAGAVRLVATGAVSAALVVGGATTAGAAPAAAPSGPPSTALVVNTFTFTGALSGSLRVQPRQDCDGAGPAGVTLSVPGELQGSRSQAFVIQVLSLNNGSYNLRPGSVIGVTISAASGVQQWGLNPRGTLTVNGTSGTVNAGLQGTDDTWLHVIGAWSCPSR